MEHKINLSPYRRIVATGCDIDVKRQSRTYRIQLTKGAELVAWAETKRQGQDTRDVAVEKAKCNAWAPSMEFYLLMCQLANTAETLHAPFPRLDEEYDDENENNRRTAQGA